MDFLGDKICSCLNSSCLVIFKCRKCAVYLFITWGWTRTQGGNMLTAKVGGSNSSGKVDAVLGEYRRAYAYVIALL